SGVNIQRAARPSVPGPASGGAWLGVSVPQLPCEAPAPTLPASTTVTPRPSSSSASAVARPDTPAPTTRTSVECVSSLDAALTGCRLEWRNLDYPAMPAVPTARASADAQRRPRAVGGPAPGPFQRAEAVLRQPPAAEQHLRGEQQEHEQRLPGARQAL